MHAERSAPVTLVLVLVGILLGGCTAASMSSEPAILSLSPSPSPVQTDAPARPSASPSASADPAPGAPSSVALPTGSPQPEPTLVPPPDATLAVEGGDPVVGEQGTWSWNNAASDAPWLPGYPIHVGANERLTFNMSDRVPIDTWQASRVPPSAVPGGDGVIGMAEGTGSSITFEAPPAGSWSVAVTVRFGDNLGDAVYYWAMTVE